MGLSSSLIYNEASDGRGMIDDETIIEYIEKAKNSICKIESDSGYGSGFFCKIPLQEDGNILLNVLLTNEHVINYADAFSEKDIKLIVDDKEKIISLKKQRKRWSNKKMDYTCIEILKEDEIKDFYTLDDKILKDDYSNDIYYKKSILVFGISKNRKRGHSDGLILFVENFNFVHNCNTYDGCSGSVIVNKKNNLVIGIHKGELKHNGQKILNVGIFIKNIIEDIMKNKEGKLIKDQLNNKEDYLSVFLNDFDMKIFKTILCKKNEKFSYLESKFYDEYPYIKKESVLFWHNERIIDNKDMTLGEYGIKSNDIINVIIDNDSNNKERDINDENIEVHFLSNDQNINYTLICKESDKFSDLQNKFYKKYPKKKDKKCFFLYKGCSINDEKKTVGENGIKNGDNILVVYLK